MPMQHCEKGVSGVFSFGANVRAAAHPCLNNEQMKSFWSGFCRQSGELKITECEQLVFSVGNAQKLTPDGNHYTVNTESTGLCITADSEKGLIDGFMTLLQQIRVKEITANGAEFQLPCGIFRENPRIENRMVHFCIFPETQLWELEKFIRFCAALKYTHIVLEFWGMLRYDCMKELSWRHAYTKNQLRPLIRMANELGLEIIPMFNHWGHASASRVIHGKHVILDQNPRLQPLFSDDGWTWNILNPDTLKLLRAVREELIDLCGMGKYFHLGCDEAYNVEITPENHTVLTEYLNSISDELAVSGRRPIVWGDMLIASRESFNPNNRYTASCADEETQRCILSDLSRSIIIADWQYGVCRSPVETALTFKEAGFDTLVCPWDNTCHCDSITPCADTAARYGLFGMLHTTWNTLSTGMPYVAKAAFEVWNEPEDGVLPPHAFFAANAAKIMRCVYPVNGDYEKAGWSKTQTAPITFP